MCWHSVIWKVNLTVKQFKQFCHVINIFSGFQNCWHVCVGLCVCLFNKHLQNSFCMMTHLSGAISVSLDDHKRKRVSVSCETFSQKNPFLSAALCLPSGLHWFPTLAGHPKMWLLKHHDAADLWTLVADYRSLPRPPFETLHQGFEGSSTNKSP